MLVMATSLVTRSWGCIDRRSMTDGAVAQSCQLAAPALDRSA